jgi:hypothetical protein
MERTVTAKIRPHAAGGGPNRGNTDLLSVEDWKAMQAGKQLENKQAAMSANKEIRNGK